jgi:hypothetical protein
MSKEIILLLHPMFGVLGVLAALWVFVEVLNASAANIGRIRAAALVVAVVIWLSYLIGGYWYVNYYAPERDLIKSGPWPFAHTFFMETKEHLFFVLLLISTYLPIAAYGISARLAGDRGARGLLMTLAGLVAVLGLVMEGSGAVMTLGVKLALLAR